MTPSIFGGYCRARSWFCLDLTVLTILAVTLNPHQLNLLLGGTAVFLLCAFGFAALIVQSYNRDKQKLIEQNRYNDDRIVK